MIHGHVYASTDQLQESLYRKLLRTGKSISARGLPTRELVAIGVTLDNPRSRFTGNAARRWSFPLAIGEFCWHVSGSTELDAISYYAPAWKKFSPDGRSIVGSCYGSRIFTPDETGRSPWERVFSCLADDPETRRGVIILSDNHFDLASSLDVPCATSLQFLIRDGRLELITCMRSNDVVWGLPYDLFLFTMLQEMMAKHLGVPLGRYHHFAGSMHIYERHLELAERVLNDSGGSSFSMPEMGDLDELAAFLNYEKELRTSPSASAESVPKKALSPYWAALAEVLVQFRISRESNPNEPKVLEPEFYPHLARAVTT